MNEDPKRSSPPNSNSPGQHLDRVAARRAHVTLQALPDVLSTASVSNLAREVISQLAARGDTPSAPQTLAQDLADALVSRDDSAAMRLTLRAVASGISVDDMYVVHLAGAAHALGDRWSADALSASQITIAAARIYAIMRALGPSMVPVTLPDDRHAVFATVPGEQHTLGVTMATDLLRRDGWSIDLMVGRTHDELLSELDDMDYVLLGLSAATQDVLPELVRLIAAVRIAHPHVRIIVAGHLAQTEPRLRELVDADYVSSKLDTLRVVMRDLHDAIAAQPGAARG